MSKKSRYTEEEMVDGCTRNDRRFQEILYRHFFTSMMQMCRRYTRDPEVAMTICNDGFLRVYKKIHTYRARGSLEGWIRRIVYHAMSDHFRRESRYIQFMVFEDFDKSSHARALTDLYYEDLLDMIKKLPDNTQKVFSLYAIEGFNHREIGELMQMSENTSKWHLANARKKLQALIKSKTDEYAQRKI